MSIQFNLEKSTEALSFALTKHNVSTIKPCQVHMVMDVSGSFRDEHRAGYTQQLLNRFVPFSMLFDKDKVLDSYAFSSNAKQLPEITAKNYRNYIEKHMPILGVGGCTTDYADAFRLMVNSVQTVTGNQQVTTRVPTQVQKKVVKPATGFFGKLFGKSEVTFETETVMQNVVETVNTVAKSDEKHLFFFVTDGDPDSESQARKTLEKLMQDNIFIVFISINSSPVRFLQTFAKQPYAMYLNYTPSQLRDLQSVSDEVLYGQLLAAPQLTAWMNK